MDEQKIKRIFPKASNDFIKLNQIVDKDNICDSVSIVEPRRKRDLNLVYNSYLRTNSVHRTGDEFGVCGETIKRDLIKSGHKLNRSAWTQSELEKLKLLYSNPQGLDRDVAAKELGRSIHSIACKAEEIGITSERGKAIKTEKACRNISSAQKQRWATNPGFGVADYMKGKPNGFFGKKHSEAVKNAQSEMAKEWHSKNEHPRGMLGKHHSVDSREAISKGHKGKKRDPASTLKQCKTRVAKFGKLALNKPHGSWKSGWRIIAGRNIYARSRWEANYARYLEFLKKHKEIKEWEHEPETFWFDKIKRGCRSYLPDFRVTLNDGSTEYHEVKGWVDARSITKAKRMKKYHPTVKIVTLGADWYKSNRIKLSGLIPEWES
jgi:hypothetical protein